MILSPETLTTPWLVRVDGAQELGTRRGPADFTAQDRLAPLGLRPESGVHRQAGRS